MSVRVTNELDVGETRLVCMILGQNTCSQLVPVEVLYLLKSRDSISLRTEHLRLPSNVVVIAVTSFVRSRVPVIQLHLT